MPWGELREQFECYYDESGSFKIFLGNLTLDEGRERATGRGGDEEKGRWGDGEGARFSIFDFPFFICHLTLGRNSDVDHPYADTPLK